MAVSYNKLWKLLIDKGLKRSQLCLMAAKICTSLGCTFDDIVEIVPDEKK